MDPFNQYRRNRILTASPGELIVMLYDGLLQRVSQAKALAEAGKWGPAGEPLGRCQDILYELMASLKPEHAPQLCEKLEWLYSYSSRALLDALVNKDVTRLDEVYGLLRPLRDAWAESSKKGRAEFGMAASA